MDENYSSTLSTLDNIRAGSVILGHMNKLLGKLSLKSHAQKLKKRMPPAQRHPSTWPIGASPLAFETLEFSFTNIS